MNREPTIPFSISWLGRLMRTRFDARARAIGLTRSQWSMIAAISVDEGATQSELASRLEINSVTAGRIIDKLEAARWIERRANPADRRTNRLYLREAAEPMLDKLSDLGLDEQRIATEGMSAEEQKLLLALLQRMIHNLTTAQPAPAPGVEADARMAPSECA